MLAFDSSLSDALETHSTESFWVLKLYYNDDTSDSNFIGVSDQDRVDGTDTYYGVVSSWGGLSHSLDFFNFTTSLMNMSVKLINTDNTIEGGRFSDLLSTNNFANRKWELFQNTGRAGTYDEPVRMIGTGIISGDFSYGVKSISLKLLDYTSKYNKQLPTAFIQNTASGDAHYYPNAPEKNIGKPIPMAYGDFYEKTDVGTIDTLFDPAFLKSRFPAIITNTMNETDGYVYANPDTDTLHTLDNEYFFIYNDGHYSKCSSTNTALSNPQLKYKGTTWYAYIPMNSDSANLTDGNFGTSTNIEATLGSVSEEISIGEVSNLGVVSSVDVILDYGTSDIGSADDFTIFNTTAYTGSSPSKTPKTTVQIQSGDGWDFAQKGVAFLEDGAGVSNVTINEMMVRVTFAPSKTLTKQFSFLHESSELTQNVREGFDDDRDNLENIIIRTQTADSTFPAEIDYIYCSGKGRKYGAWIEASRSVGYIEDALIENPVFIIESLMRDELSLTSSEIDITSFNTSGHSSTGDIKNIFSEDNVDDIKFAFSQSKFINSKDLINRICKQSFSWVFISGDGKYKIKTLEASGWSANKTIDFNDCNLKSISRTSLGGVRNDITINYNKDYGQDQFLSSVNPTADSVSTLKTVAGYNQTLKMKMDSDILDTTTATKLAEAYMAVFKDRKIIIDFDCGRAKYNDLEIGDIIKFSNWDSAIKLYGVTLVESGGSTDYFIIQSISKKPNGSSIKAIKVS